MFGLKKASVMCHFTNKLANIQTKFNARKFSTTVNNQTIIKNNLKSFKSQTSRQSHMAPLLSAYMEPELKKNGALYEHVYQDMIHELADELTLKPNESNEIKDHFIKMVDYVLSDGHRQTSDSCTKMYQDLMVNKKITTENIKQVYRLGWCMEMQLAAILIIDDIIDNSEIRRNKKCWHKLDGMERIAINDILMMENGCHRVLNRYFCHLPCYTGLMKTVTEAYMTTLMGVSLENRYNEMGVDHFTLENYAYAAVMKGSYFRFYMPAALAMLLAGYDLNTDEKAFDAIKLITSTMGLWYQAQNDFFDFVDQELNKPGHDIENSNLTWFATMAMIHGSEDQKDTMRKNYGKYDADCVAKVKEVYHDLQLPEKFSDWKERNQREVKQQINQLLQSDEILRNACSNFFKYAYYH